MARRRRRVAAHATAGRPLPAGMGLEVERAEFVDADDHLRVAIQDVVGAVHQPVQVQDAVLLGLEGQVLDCFQVLIT